MSVLKNMRPAPEALLVFLVLSAALAGDARPLSQSPAPAASPSPSPTPRYKLLPYGFESPKERSTVPLLRFEDQAEVRALEMNAAIARFFDKSNERGNMLRGATPGGAPTLRDMTAYRPHVTPAIDLLGVAAAAVREIKKRIDLRRGMPAAEASPTPSPSP